MTKKILSLFVVIALLLIPLSAATAQEDGVGTPEDNACNPGGVMAGKCTTVWHWKAGWFLARLLTGRLTRDQVPAEFASILPPLPPAEDVVVADAACIYDPSATQHDMIIAAIDTLNGGIAMISKDGSCTGGVNYIRTIVEHNSQANAEAKFMLISGFAGTCANLVAKGYVGVSATWWECS